VRFRSLLRLLRVHPSRLASVPRVRVLGRTSGSEVTTLHLAVDGLVCAACAARTASALRALPGVRAARVDLVSGTAEVVTSAPLRAAALEAALASVVVAPRARRAIERVVTRWRARGLTALREGRAWLR
jgi:copper chaperone CopZ